MPLLNENIEKQIRQVFEALEKPVKLVLFTSSGESGDADGECLMCNDTRLLLEEVAALSDKTTVEVLDIQKDAAAAAQYQVDKVPAVVILGPDQKDWGIRLYGIPSGYEFSSLIEDILLASTQKHDLKPATLRELGRLKEPVHIQVYVTPT